MRELAGTGFMSNRGRQNVASLLAKDLKQDWRQGGLGWDTVTDGATLQLPQRIMQRCCEQKRR